MARWGKGRFMKWKEEAFAICYQNSGGIEMESILANTELDYQNVPQSVRHGTELLKRDSRFTSFYPPKGRYSIIGRSHRKVLQWTVEDDEE
jgi:hypothetical protein